MNYQHSYHAGNFADVVKHVLLIQLMAQFSQKPKPFYILDAYAGRGLYSLASQQAKKTQEAAQGIAKLHQHPTDKNTPTAIQTYLDDLTYAQKFYQDKHIYTGSPWLIARHLQKHPDIANRAEAFEHNPEEYDALNYQLHQLPIGIHHRNAYEGIPAVIPPAEKRGLIFIDPPYEQEHKDFTQLIELIEKAHKKWPTGTYALWYPIKNPKTTELFHKKAKRTGIKKQLICELNIYPTDLPVGLNGTGLHLINPPYQFDQHAQHLLNYLAPILKPNNSTLNPKNATKIKWLTTE